MKTKPFLSLVVLTCTVMLLGESSGGSLAAPTDAGRTAATDAGGPTHIPELSKADAMEVIHAIGGVEQSSFDHTQTFLPLEKLPLDQVTAGEKAFPASSVGSGVLKDHKLRVFTSANGKGYMTALLPRTPGCGYSMFSDESRVIYEAPPLNCSGESDMGDASPTAPPHGLIRHPSASTAASGR